jgi:hypothetical protein
MQDRVVKDISYCLCDAGGKGQFCRADLCTGRWRLFQDVCRVTMNASFQGLFLGDLPAIAVQ